MKYQVSFRMKTWYHVKITCYLHTWKDHHCYGYIINRSLRSTKKLTWHFTGIYIINRTLHGRLEIRSNILQIISSICLFWYICTFFSLFTKTRIHYSQSGTCSYFLESLKWILWHGYFHDIFHFGLNCLLHITVKGKALFALWMYQW